VITPKAVAGVVSLATGLLIEKMEVQEDCL
jgi:hypothetical protein